MMIPMEKLKQVLVEPGHFSLTQFNDTFKEAREIFESSLDSGLKKDEAVFDYFLTLLSEKGFISDDNLGKIIADVLGYPFADLKSVKIEDELLSLIPEIVVSSQKAIIFDRGKEGLKLAAANPKNYEFIKLLEKKTGEKIEVYYATPQGIKEALKYYKSDLKNRVKTLIQELDADQREKNIVKLVDLFLEYAYDNRASDIHLEPLEKIIGVRFRIDGILHEVVSYPKALHEKIVFRIKIMSRLRTDEHAAAQDGRFDYQKDDLVFDVRVSVLPVMDGENVVMRLLAERSRRLSLEELGFSKSDLERVRRAILKPYGMILAAGPTGCGKTTTLYAILQILNRREVNIMTIEDPVEYDIEHVQQTQVNPKKELTFATGLRSIVRQDPDIIMVGEIRDNETASIAINAAMTGHLLLSTLHSNDAATAFPRLIEMDIEPFLVASSANVIIAQRLIRKTCEKCKISYFLSREELKIIKSESMLAEYIEEVGGGKDISKIRFYKGSGCNVCAGTGYRGRTGIFEVMEVEDELRVLITQKMTSDVICKKAMKLGMTSMLYSGIVKVFEGITTLEEVLRATKS